MKFVALFLMVLTLSTQATTITTSVDKIEQFHSVIPMPLPEDNALITGQWRAEVNQLELAERIMLVQHWLNLLAQHPQPTVAQQAWVQLIAADLNKLVIANPDHPHTFITVVDLASQAKATQYIWKVQQQVDELNSDWQSGRLDWQALLSQQSAQQVDAMISWINSLDVPVAQAVAVDFENYGLDHLGVSNRLLATIALAGRSSVLAHTLLQRSPDQYSYWFIQQSGNFFTDYEHISLLGLALSNPALSSQALNVLAKKYSMDRQAQEHLEQAIKNPDLQWQAVAALAFMPENSFRSVLVEQIEQYNLPSKILLERLPIEGAVR